MSDERDVLAEHVLRRALRLDADEMPPRLDPALIAAAAAARPAQGQQRLVIAIVAAFIGGWVWSEIFRGIVAGVLAATGTDIVGTAVGLVTEVAIMAAPYAATLTDPVIPIAVLAAAAIAFLAERGRSHAAASS